MEPKIIKEEIPDLKDSNDLTTSPVADPIQATRRSKGARSPESPEDGRTNAASPSLGRVTSSLQNTASPSSTLAVSPNAGASSPPTTPNQHGARPNWTKLKRFLSTLVQFGAEINPELGEKVRNLVFNMVNGSMTIEEFHTSLQEATNFPLRPFVMPFLRTHIPLLQKELSFQARIAKQTTSQYLKHHEQLVLDPSFSPSEPSEIFNSDQTSENGKRKHSESIYENGLSNAKENIGSEPQQKKERLQHSQPMPTLFGSLSTFQNFPSAGNYNFQFSGLNGHGSHQAYTSGFNTSLLGSNFHFLNSLSQSAPPHLVVGNSDYSSHQDLNSARGKDDRSAEEEWKNINTMLNCILSMVEKTKRALSILQTRERGTPTESDVKRAANEIIRVTEDRIAEIKRRAEEAVNEVKRQAIVELERVAIKNNKNKEDMEENSSDAQGGAQNLCWNCGRKAQETCSGCNIARYCGSYCQHRDWETHHQVCCPTTDRRPKTLPLGSLRYDQEERRHLIEERRNILEERRNFIDDRARRYSTDENRRYEERKEDVNKRNEKDKEKVEGDRRNENQNEKAVEQQTNEIGRGSSGSSTGNKYSDLDRLNPEVNRNRLLPNISSQILNLDNIRRMKNQVSNREGTEEKSYGENASKKCNSLNSFAGTGSQRGSRCRPNSRSGTPLGSTASHLGDSQITK